MAGSRFHAGCKAELASLELVRGNFSLEFISLLETLEITIQTTPGVAVPKLMTKPQQRPDGRLSI
jgi:hypothetical protein